MFLNQIDPAHTAPQRRFLSRLAAHMALAAMAAAGFAVPASAQGGAPSTAPQQTAPGTGSQYGYQNQQVNPNQQQGNQTGQPNQNGQRTNPQSNQDPRNPNRDQTRDRDQNRQDDRLTAPPDALTDFQRLIAETTGATLPIFGANLFNGLPSTFAPVDDVPVSPDYILGPGDELRIDLYGAVNQSGRFAVSRTGEISYPDVGSLHVAGLRYSQLQSFLRAQLGRVYRNFDLNVNLGQLRSIQIFVTGQARRPGSFTVSSLSTLLNALFESGGPLPQGSLRDIQVNRGNQTVVHFDLYDLLLRGDKSKDIQLEPGDVIFIPVAGPQLAISGSVNNPAIYEIRPGTTVQEAIALAGGRTNVAVGSRIRLDRVFEGATRSIVDVNLAQGQNPPVADGDILTVSSIQDQYKGAVTLRGNVAAPGRYVWRPGLRIMDVVPTAAQLITRDYYLRRNAEGNAATAFGATIGGGLGIRATGSTQLADAATATGTANAGAGASSIGAALADTGGQFPALNDVVLSAPDVDLSYAVIERLNPQTLATTLISFNPGKLYLEGDQTQNLELQSGDVITFFSTADIRVPTAQQTRFVRLEGEFFAPGPYSVRPGETLRQLLARAGGLTPDAYLYGSQFTRESTRRVQVQRLNEYADNLDAEISAYSARSTGSAISAQDVAATTAAQAASRETVARLRRIVPVGRIVLAFKPDSRFLSDVPDIALEDGDRFTVPRTPATVGVQGQVYSANDFLWLRGHRERDYMRQAGGPARNADVKRIFILRADGSVYSEQYGPIGKATMFPGDSIVVPPKFDRPAFFRDLVDLSAVVGEFGVGAAAVYLLR